MRFRNIQTISRKRGSGGPTKITPHVMDIVEQQMQHDDETAASASPKYWLRYTSSNDSALPGSLGWTFRGSAYLSVDS